MAGGAAAPAERQIVERLPYEKVLAIFPHPDDEAVTCGGTLSRLAEQGALVTVLILTRGERGNPSGRPDQSLKTIREGEAKEAARILGVSRLTIAEFPDGGIANERDRARAYLAEVLVQLQPDLVITYDLAGLDGHPDHVACAEILTELRQRRFGDLRLWYVALPTPLLLFLSLVGQIQQTDWLTERRSRPTHAVFIGTRLIAKSRAVRAYNSQRLAIGKGLGTVVPTWLTVGLMPLEYFEDAR